MENEFDENKDIEKIRDEFRKSIDNAENDFEKKITQISAGALALSITFIDKIVDLSNANYLWILITGWILLGFTLSLNLFNTLFSRKENLKSLNEYDEIILNKDSNSEILSKNIEKRNNLIIFLDYLSLTTLILGISFIIMFSSLNLHNQTKNIKMEKKEIIKEGRKIKKPKPIPNPDKSNKTQPKKENKNNKL